MLMHFLLFFFFAILEGNFFEGFLGFLILLLGLLEVIVGRGSELLLVFSLAKDRVSDVFLGLFFVYVFLKVLLGGGLACGLDDGRVVLVTAKEIPVKLESVIFHPFLISC